VSVDDLRHDFEPLTIHLKTVPSTFVWNADETRLGAAKQQARPEVIVAAETPPGTVTVAKSEMTAN
jgi:hypothetical protein